MILSESAKKLKTQADYNGRCKEDSKCKYILQSVEKPYASVVYSLRTYSIRSTHQATVHKFHQRKQF